MLAAIQRIEGRGCHETAQRTFGSCRDVFQYAETLGYCQHDVTEGIFPLLQRPVRAHFPAITKGELAAPLLQEIWNYRGTAVVQSAFRTESATCFADRESCGSMEWEFVNLEKRQWVLRLEKDEAREKARRKENRLDDCLIVPLARQACQILGNSNGSRARANMCFRDSGRLTNQ